jgi:N-acyl-L-homoserine lactone synthetase
MTSDRTVGRNVPAPPDGAGNASPCAGQSSSQGDLHALELMDRVTAHLVAASTPLRIAEALTEEERNAAFRLRCRAIVARGWRPASDFPDGLEREPIDDDAVHLVARDGDIPVGTIRLILPRPGVPLPLETSFGVKVEPAGLYAEATRITVAREYSSNNHRISAALLSSVWLATRARGYNHLLGDVSDGMARLYRLFGFVLVPRSPTLSYWGERRTLIYFDAIASAERVAARWLPPDQRR